MASSTSPPKSTHYESFQDFLDDVQYSKQGLARYEWIFGETFLSTGGLATTKEILDPLNLREGMRVLDVGCGCGGSAIYMAENYGVTVDAIDLSKNMMSIAHHHLSKRPHIQNLVKLRIADATVDEFDEEAYDLIYSRDALLHISDKERLFERFYKWLKPGGRVVFTDYGRGDQEHSEEFKRYIAKRGYHLATLDQYREIMEQAGFVDILLEDKRDRFVGALEAELKKLVNGKDDFLSKFTQEDYDELESGWKAKIIRADSGDQTWIFGEGTKSLSN